MEPSQTVIAVYPTHAGAENAVRKIAASGFDMKSLSLVGKGYHTEEKVIGFYKAGDRIKFWGVNGAFWGGLWGLFFGGLFLTLPPLGPVIALGYVAAAAMSAVEGAVVVGGLSALGAALYSVGIPKDSILSYESAVRADGFLVMARGEADAVARAKAILGAESPSAIAVHAGAEQTDPVPALAQDAIG